MLEDVTCSMCHFVPRFGGKSDLHTKIVFRILYYKCDANEQLVCIPTLMGREMKSNVVEN